MNANTPTIFCKHSAEVKINLIAREAAGALFTVSYLIVKICSIGLIAIQFK